MYLYLILKLYVHADVWLSFHIIYKGMICFFNPRVQYGLRIGLVWRLWDLSNGILQPKKSDYVVIRVCEAQGSQVRKNWTLRQGSSSAAMVSLKSLESTVMALPRSAEALLDLLGVAWSVCASITLWMQAAFSVEDADMGNIYSIRICGKVKVIQYICNHYMLMGKYIWCNWPED